MLGGGLLLLRGHCPIRREARLANARLRASCTSVVFWVPLLRVGPGVVVRAPKVDPCRCPTLGAFIVRRRIMWCPSLMVAPVGRGPDTGQQAAQGRGHYAAHRVTRQEA